MMVVMAAMGCDKKNGKKYDHVKGLGFLEILVNPMHFPLVSIRPLEM